MTRGFLLLMIWSITMAICGSSKRMSFLATMFDVPNDHSLKDYSTYFKIPKTTREDDLVLDLVQNSGDFHYVVPLLFTKRRQNVYSNVEVGPGAFKSETIQYPPDALKKQLSNLLKLKKKLEDRTESRI